VMITEFPLLKIVKLKDIASQIQYGYTAKAKGTETGPRFLRITDIQDDSVEWLTVPSCEIPTKDKEKYLLSEGDIVFARTGATVGKSYLIRGNVPEAVFASYLIRVRLQHDVEPKYINYFFRSPSYWRQISESSAGIGQPNVNGSKLADLRIPLAPPEDQKRIVAEIENQFSRLDEAVASLKRIQANLKRYKVAVLKAAVEGKLTEQWRKDHPDVEPADQLLKRILAERRAKWEAEELAKMKAKGSVGARHSSPDSWKKKFKEPTGPDTANLPELPEGWLLANVDQLAEVGTGATPRRDRPDYYKNGDVPWVTSSVVNKPFVDEASEFVTTSALADTNLTQYPSGTLLVAMYGEGKTRGKCSELRISASTNQALAALQTDPKIRRYLRLFLDYNYEETRKVASGGVQPNLNLSLVRSLLIPLPPLAEQLQIVAEIDRRLSVTEELETTIETNLKRAERLRQTILMSAFSGNIAS